MKFPFLFKTTEITATTTTTSTAAAPSWPWPSCATSPKTLSFRANTKTYLDIKTTTETANTTPDSSPSTCNSSDHHHEETPSTESAVVSGLLSERLFFQPGETNSILEEAKTQESGNVAMMAIDSTDPFLDFRVSMAEMVEAHHALKNWEFLEGLLECYLKVNDRSNYGYIVEAFIDLLIHLDSTSTSNVSAIDENCSSSSTTTTTTTQYSFTSPLSFSSPTNYSSVSPCLSSLENEDRIVFQERGDCSLSSMSFNA